MIYSGIVITAVNAAFFEESNQDNLVCKVQDKLCIFCSGELVDNVKAIREKYDPELKNTLIIPYHEHNTEAQHLYCDRIAGFFNDDVATRSKQLLSLTRYAFVRDYFLNNHFKNSHAMWVDWDAKFLSNMDPHKNLFNNLALCMEKEVLFFDTSDSQHKELFILPQEMAWNFNYLNRLIQQDHIYNGHDPRTLKIFEAFRNRHPEQIEVVQGSAEHLCTILQYDGFPTYPTPVSTDKTLVVVVNHYQHDTSWTQRLLHPCVIYNKNPNDFDKYERNLPNVGFDSIVYFTYIIENYDNLPDYVCFLQDDPFFHCMDVIQTVNSFNFDRPFVPMGTSYYLGGHDWAMTETYAEKVGLPFERPLKMITSCQSIISKEKILTRSKEFYQLLISTIDKTVKCPDNYGIENLWPTIFSFNEELVPCLNCKGHGDKQ
jgi:hypothetical protein